MSTILLDDAFQYITLKRDVNILVLDALNPFGYNELIPAGLLREPIKNISRADVIWINKCDLIPSEKLNKLENILTNKFQNIPIVESCYRITALKTSKTLEKKDIKILNKNKILALSGIGNCIAFEQMLEDFTGASVAPYRFSDHHPFTADDLQKAEIFAKDNDIHYIVTTEKDDVRIPKEFFKTLEWFVVEIDIKIIKGEEIVKKICSKKF